MELEEWQHHVIKEPRLAYCGTPVWVEWLFQDKEHALWSVQQCQYVQPCPACLAAIHLETARPAEH